MRRYFVDRDSAETRNPRGSSVVVVGEKESRLCRDASSVSRLKKKMSWEIHENCRIMRAGELWEQENYENSRIMRKIIEKW